MAINPQQWTLKTQEAVSAAVDQAKSLSNPELTPDHVMAAILRQSGRHHRPGRAREVGAHATQLA